MGQPGSDLTRHLSCSASYDLTLHTLALDRAAQN
jgi:hypothetical protein